MSEAHAKTEIRFDCGVYLHGDTLDPKVVSELLDILPTKSWKRDETFVSRSGIVTGRKSGLWSLSTVSPQHQFEPMIEGFLEKVDRSGMRICEIPGVDLAKISIFWSIVSDRTDSVDFHPEVSRVGA